MQNVLITLLFTLCICCHGQNSSRREETGWLGLFDLNAAHSKLNNHSESAVNAGVFVGVGKGSWSLLLSYAKQSQDDSGGGNTRIDVDLSRVALAMGYRISKFLALEGGIGTSEYHWTANNFTNPDDPRSISESIELFHVEASSNVWKKLSLYARHTSYGDVNQIYNYENPRTLDLGARLTFQFPFSPP